MIPKDNTLFAQTNVVVKKDNYLNLQFGDFCLEMYFLKKVHFVIIDYPVEYNVYAWSCDLNYDLHAKISFFDSVAVWDRVFHKHLFTFIQ